MNQHTPLSSLLQSSNPIFIVTYDYTPSVPGQPERRSTGTYELDMDRMSQRMIADDIMSGQFPGVSKVYECVPGERCEDVTEDVAQLIIKQMRADFAPLRWDMKDWLHKVLDVQCTRGMVEA